MKHKLLALLMAVGFLGGVVPAAIAESEINEGFEYKLISPPQPTITKNKVEVIELFWYGCPHCYKFEPTLNKWLENKPDNVVFYRIPAIFGSKRWAIHARAFYTAKLLGLIGEGKSAFHEAFFDEIHKHKKPLGSKKAIQKFFKRFGVSAEDFNNTFDSFTVNTKVNRAITLSRRYQIEGVPSLVINGKYRTDGPLAGGRKGMIKVLNYLIEKESKK